MAVKLKDLRKNLHEMPDYIVSNNISNNSQLLQLPINIFSSGYS
jgi:hypothetical protein